MLVNLFCHSDRMRYHTINGVNLCWWCSNHRAILFDSKSPAGWTIALKVHSNVSYPGSLGPGTARISELPVSQNCPYLRIARISELPVS